MKFNITAMLNKDVYDHPVDDIQLIETHISWVILTGEYAYKIKKPVNFGFLNFTTLKKRKKYCEQELRLNSRLAADIYLQVVSIAGSLEHPIISENDTEEDVFEYAVKMRQFPQSAQLDNKLQAGELGSQQIDAIAFMIAEFHQTTAVAKKDTDYGEPESIFKPVRENFELISESLKTSVYDEKLDVLKDWSFSEFDTLQPVFKQRKYDGFIRECHGDMHLRNLVWLDNKPLAFDCIEFNSNLRWIDVISEIAFLMMDLQDRRQNQLANRFLNAYLEITGDYQGLSVLSFYLCYRAMVRAKVDALRLEQISDDNVDIEAKELSEFDSFIDLATGYIKQPEQKLIIMRGLSASGKSTVSQHVLENTGAIRIRSDVERKRLFSIPLYEKAKTSSAVDEGVYSTDSSDKTYKKLLELASTVLDAGNTVLVDAACLKHEQRLPFEKLAKSRGVTFIILEVTASFDVLRQRIIDRKKDVSDADISVLEHQISHWKPLANSEAMNAVSVNTENPLDIKSLLSSINKKTTIDLVQNS